MVNNPLVFYFEKLKDDYDLKTYGDIAKYLDISIGTVKNAYGGRTINPSKRLVEHIADVEKFKRIQKEVERLANNKLEKMELPDIPEPEIKINPITKSESVKLSKTEFDQIKQVIDYQQTQITSLEAHKSDLSAELEINKQTINRIKNKPYVLENERLSAELEKKGVKLQWMQMN